MAPGMAASHNMNLKILKDIEHLKRDRWHLLFRPKTLTWALMDDLGASIFDDLIHFTDVAEVAAKFAHELEVPVMEIAQEIQRFLGVLKTKGLLREEETPRPLVCHDFRPRSLYLHLTARCNLTCLYCYNCKERESWRNDLPYSLAKVILRQAKEMGIPTVVFTGGEPLLNPHFFEIAELAANLGLRVFLLTNGVLIDETKAKELAHLCDQIVVSLDSASPMIHDRLRGTGTHKRVEMAIKRLKEAGAREVVISSVITRYNQFELAKDFERYANEIGADRAVRQIYMLQGDQRDHFLTPDFQALVSQMEKDLENMIVSKVKPTPANSIWRDRCGAAFGEIAVAPDGSVYPCQGLVKPEFAAGNIIANDLAEIWKKSGILARVRAITVDDIPKCRDCSFRYLCGGGCRALAYTVHHSLTMPIPEGYCAFNRILAEQKLWATALHSLVS